MRFPPSPWISLRAPLRFCSPVVPPTISPNTPFNSDPVGTISRYPPFGRITFLLLPPCCRLGRLTSSLGRALIRFSREVDAGVHFWFLLPPFQSRLPSNANLTSSPAVIMLNTLHHSSHAPRSATQSNRSVSFNRCPNMSAIQQPNNEVRSQILSSRAFEILHSGYKNMSSTGLTPRSTRTQPARATATSPGTDCPSSLTVRPPVGPVNFFR